jgi:hypothetical protein
MFTLADVQFTYVKIEARQAVAWSKYLQHHSLGNVWSWSYIPYLLKGAFLSLLLQPLTSHTVLVEPQMGSVSLRATQVRTSCTASMELVGKDLSSRTLWSPSHLCDPSTDLFISNQDWLMDLCTRTLWSPLYLCHQPTRLLSTVTSCRYGVMQWRCRLICLDPSPLYRMVLSLENHILSRLQIHLQVPLALAKVSIWHSVPMSTYSGVSTFPLISNLLSCCMILHLMPHFCGQLICRYLQHLN